MEDVKIAEHLIKDEQGKIKGKITILVGGLDGDNPKEYMDAIVRNYVKHELHNQFIEIHLDNPWTRVIIRDINSIKFRKMKINDSIANDNE